MLKFFLISLIYPFLVASFNAQASFIDVDAFADGDKMAMYDEETNLTWLDFGVNNGQSFNDVMAQLTTTHTEWRLPTEEEVAGLWDKLMEGSGSDALFDVFDVWGANKTPLEHLPYLCWGYFLDSAGFLGAGSLIETGSLRAEYGSGKYYEDGKVDAAVLNRVVDVIYDGSDFYPFAAAGTLEISTLLVRKSNLPVPSSLALICIALFGLAYSRKTKVM